jgi:hypothetical protein
MGLSETIVAAMIGALATVSGAVFQIFSSIKARNKVDVKPRRGSTLRSMFAVLALMVASAVGGFLYSELLRQQSSEDLRAMRVELRELKELTAAARTTPVQPVEAAQPAAQPPITQVSSVVAPSRVESLAYVPACRRAAAATESGTWACEEHDAQRIALCASVPAYARIDAIDLFAQPDAVQRPWDEHRVALEQDVGGARFTGKSFEYSQSTDVKAVCVNFAQWSSEHSHIARIVVNFGFGERSPPAAIVPPADAVPAVIATDTLPPLSQQAAFVTDAKP